MSLRLTILSDTHLPLRARALPEPVWAAIEAADVVLHAGDWVSEDLLNQIEARSRRLVAVYGNNDGPGLQARLPEVARVELEGLRVAVVHDSGPAKNRETRCAAIYADTDLLVFGHSHIPWDTTAPTGLRLINPGSPTDRRQQPFCTYLTATVTEGRLQDVELHRLPVRTAQSPKPEASASSTSEVE